ncbi:Hsp20/alpha crystallin family protein [Syntrophomonas palmitatica]|uniref:Hsp20/alpha crystallin family protein n=1 Tax=Syntrophomonas palmitatica TaxID=402877 RepID=UPI0006D2B431|nr:Hsp20/alpha crystallin family protein [Syntrophomonas palmitatica]
MFDLTPFRRSRGDLVGGDFGRALLREFFDNDFFDFAPSFKADIRENGQEFIVEAELPGMKKDEIVVELKDNTLTISAEKKEEINEEKDNYVRRERRMGTFRRSFYVENVDDKRVKADYKDGVLKIILPKLEETPPQNYRISID